MKRRSFLKGLFGAAVAGPIIAKEIINSPPEPKYDKKALAEDIEYSMDVDFGKSGDREVSYLIGKGAIGNAIISPITLQSWERKTRERAIKESVWDQWEPHQLVRKAHPRVKPLTFNKLLS